MLRLLLLYVLAIYQLLTTMGILLVLILTVNSFNIDEFFCTRDIVTTWEVGDAI